MAADAEPVAAKALKQWLSKHGGGFHEDVMIVEDTWGVSVVAKESLPSNAIVVSCPFSLIITRSLARSALSSFVDVQPPDNWTERQWIATYICFHWIVDQNTTEQSQKLLHYEYIHLLPSPDKLRTPHYFTASELEAFRGTNLYGATLDRQREWRAEYDSCLTAVSEASTEWAKLFTWERYLAGATYLTSRAFPSSLLASNPSLIQDPATEPVLIPGLDLLNHARGAAVTWSVTYPVPNSPYPSRTLPLISLVLHNPAEPRQEIFNNYGPKPNSELILGYGFSIRNNPEDSVILKVGGLEGERWHVGRQGRGVEGIWQEIIEWVKGEEEVEWEDQQEAGMILMEMAHKFLDKIPQAKAEEDQNMRQEVGLMQRDYIEGQRDVLEGIIEFAAGWIEADRSAGNVRNVPE